MTSLRLSVNVPGARADEVRALAAGAEGWNLDGVWVGDCRHRAANADDTYAIVAVAGAATATSDIRLGAFLSGRGSAAPLRLAEDIGVVDAIAGGRLAVAFSAPEEPDDQWAGDVERLLSAWRGWSLPDGRTMPVTPAPTQPVLPVYLVEDGRGSPMGGAAAPGGPCGLLAVPWPVPTEPPSASDLIELRRRCHAAAAGEAVLVLSPDDLADIDRILAVLGTVVAPCLRAAEHEVEILALDARRWLEACTDLHHAPG